MPRRKKPIDLLIDIMARLRAPDGCPWDREQSHRTLRHHAVEEVYELLDAIEANEGCRLLEEGVVTQWQVIDDTMVAGFNRPGVMADAVKNYEKWTELLTTLAEKIKKPYIKPCEYLRSGKFVPMK